MLLVFIDVYEYIGLVHVAETIGFTMSDHAVREQICPGRYILRHRSDLLKKVFGNQDY